MQKQTPIYYDPNYEDSQKGVPDFLEPPGYHVLCTIYPILHIIYYIPYFRAPNLNLPSDTMVFAPGRGMALCRADAHGSLALRGRAW